MIRIRVLQLIDRKVDIAERFALDLESIRSPGAGSYKDCLVAISEEIVDRDRGTDRCIRSDLDAFQDQVSHLKVVQDRFRKSEFRNAVSQDSANLVMNIKDRYLIAVSGQDHRNGQSGRT